MSNAALNWAWSLPSLCSSAKAIVVYLANCADAVGECFPSVRDIAKKTGLSINTVQKWLRQLREGMGLIERKERVGATGGANGRQTSNVYRLRFDATFKGESAPIHEPLPSPQPDPEPTLKPIQPVLIAAEFVASPAPPKTIPGPRTKIGGESLTSDPPFKNPPLTPPPQAASGGDRNFSRNLGGEAKQGLNHLVAAINPWPSTRTRCTTPPLIERVTSKAIAAAGAMVPDLLAARRRKLGLA
jgi:DNA-binding transcriptional MocR family regulator